MTAVAPLPSGQRTRVGQAVHETFQSLHVRNFRLFFGGQLISQVGNWLTNVAQTLLVLKLTNSGVALGLLAVMQFGPLLVLGPWTGVIADRSDKRKLLLIIQSLAMLQSFAMAALAFSGEPPLLAIYGVALVGGFCVAFDNPTRRAFVVEMVPVENINNAVSLNSTLMTGSRVVGPALAGLLISTVGFGWCFLIDGVSYVAVLAGLWMMRPEELREVPIAARGKGQVREGIRYARSVPELWAPLVMGFVIGALAFNFQIVIPLFVTRDLGGTDTTFTWLFSVISVGSVIGALGTARSKNTDVRVVGITALMFGAALGAMALAPNEAVAFSVAFFVGIGSVSFLTQSTSIVHVRADAQMRGRVLALQSMVFLGSTPIGGPLLGWVSQNYGARYGLGLGAVATLGIGFWGVVLGRRLRHLSVTAAEAERAAAEAQLAMGGETAPVATERA